MPGFPVHHQLPKLSFNFMAAFTILEKEMATHSRIIARKIPWTEEPYGLQSIGSQRVGHDCSDLAHMQCLFLGFPGG